MTPETEDLLVEAQALKASHQPNAALQAYARVLAEDSQRPDVCIAMGHLLCDLGRPEQALVMFRRAAALAPQEALALSGQGRAHRQLNQPQEAFAQFKAALRLQPDLMSAYVDIGQLLIRFGQLSDARTSFQSGLAIQPQFGPLHEGLGLIAMRENDYPAALKHYQDALTFGPVTAGLLSNAANCLMAFDRYEDALPLLADALAKDPKLAVAHYNRGVCLTRLNKLPHAIEAYDQTVALQPNNAGAQFNRALLHLKQGDYAQGFPGYNWRFTFDPSYQDEQFTQPAWQGEPLDGKTLLVVAEQGMGDTLQFARFLPQLRQQGARILLMVQPPLLSLFETWPEVDAVLPKPPVQGPTQMDQGLSYDTYVYLMSLPALMGTTLKTLPPAMTLENLPRETLSTWQDRLGNNPRLKVGVVWASKADNPTSAWRSCPLSHFLALTHACPGVSFYSLQKGPAEADLNAHILPENFKDLAPDITDFIDTACAIQQLDVILTVDTAVAHLAASLNKSVWLLLPYWSDWRWLPSGETSPWYPSVQVFRSPAFGDWSSVFSQVSARLK